MHAIFPEGWALAAMDTKTGAHSNVCSVCQYGDLDLMPALFVRSFIPSSTVT